MSTQIRWPSIARARSSAALIARLLPAVVVDQQQHVLHRGLRLPGWRKPSGAAGANDIGDNTKWAALSRRARWASAGGDGRKRLATAGRRDRTGRHQMRRAAGGRARFGSRQRGGGDGRSRGDARGDRGGARRLGIRRDRHRQLRPASSWTATRPAMARSPRRPSRAGPGPISSGGCRRATPGRWRSRPTSTAPRSPKAAGARRRGSPRMPISPSAPAWASASSAAGGRCRASP